MTNERLLVLFGRFREGNCSGKELQELYTLSLLPENHETLEQLAETAWHALPLEGDMPTDSGEAILRRILEKSLEEAASKPAPIRKLFWRRITVAASLLLLLGLAVYFDWFNLREKDKIERVVSDSYDVSAPATNRATITLSDGSIVYLDSVQNGTLSEQGSSHLVKLNEGHIAYQPTGNETGRELRYNTLSNPRGSKVIHLQLSDGSFVWLNAGSSLTYPVEFIGDERVVSMTGEAYFEVASQLQSTNGFTQKRSFVVQKDDLRVEVLGTDFNVNAYDDENNIKVSLLEGSVTVNNTLIRPGQQAQVGETVRVVSDIDLEEVMAWKNGQFQFGGATIEEVMRQLARWYDVEVIYEDKPTEHFMGQISRQVEVSKVLKMLEATEAVHFRIQNKKVYVTE